MKLEEEILSIRKRPGLFIASINADGLSLLTFRCLNIINQQVKNCNCISITMERDNVLRVAYDGDNELNFDEDLNERNPDGRVDDATILKSLSEWVQVNDEGHKDIVCKEIIFKPDPLIFKNILFNYESLEKMLKSYSLENKHLKLTLTDSATNKSITF